MNGNRILIDTNIAIYLLDGDRSLAEILHHKTIYISFITQLELLSYAGITASEESVIHSMLDSCKIMDINDAIKKEVIRLRRNNAIKLPDCIVAASSIYLDIPLMTADRGFLKLEELSLMFYEK